MVNCNKFLPVDKGEVFTVLKELSCAQVICVILTSRQYIYVSFCSIDSHENGLRARIEGDHLICYTVSDPAWGNIDEEEIRIPLSSIAGFLPLSWDIEDIDSYQHYNIEYEYDIYPDRSYDHLFEITKNTITSSPEIKYVRTTYSIAGSILGRRVTKWGRIILNGFVPLYSDWSYYNRQKSGLNQFAIYLGGIGWERPVRNEFMKCLHKPPTSFNEILADSEHHREVVVEGCVSFVNDQPCKTMDQAHDWIPGLIVSKWELQRKLNNPECLLGYFDPNCFIYPKQDWDRIMFPFRLHCETFPSREIVRGKKHELFLKVHGAANTVEGNSTFIDDHRKAEQYFKERQVQKALKLIQSAIDKRPDSLGLKNDKAWYLYTSGDLRKARNLSLEILQKDPNYWRTIDTLARIYENQGNIRSAIKMSEKLISIAENISDASNEVKEAYNRIKQLRNTS